MRYLLLLLTLAACNVQPEPEAFKLQLKPCEEASTLEPGFEFVLEVTTEVCADNFIISVEQDGKLVRVVHTCKSTTVVINTVPGVYRVGVLMCGSGSTTAKYTVSSGGNTVSNRVGVLEQIVL